MRAAVTMATPICMGGESAFEGANKTREMWAVIVHLETETNVTNMTGGEGWLRIVVMQKWVAQKKKDKNKRGGVT